ncbi:LysR family transcriptional regulator [Marinomonas pollencensis]|uniref:DNA-binding transcriptional LysR family regulator n=1 Tax=Marinomonas pollencensis TaxID=491954 RepID=A0A3E0DTH6_9GAMM|nr:LysR family transcriptional regulator [Marinomonas pollencensis]REG86696.1 DNA-binding transcriptional LysR family regulator [Marinomonas pollencensis]
MPLNSRDEIHSVLYSSTLNVFLAVCQYRSFTKAAKVLNLSQSSVSQNIQKLEESLEVLLFDRDVRPITPKPEAIILQELLEKQFFDIEQAVEEIRERNELKPIVKIGVIDSLSSNIAPALIRMLSGQTRQVSVLSGISPNIANDLINKEVDIIITCDSLDGVNGLSRYFLCQEPHLLVLPKKSELVGEKISWQKLINSDLSFVKYSTRSSSGRIAETHFSRMRMTVPSRAEADTTSVVLSMIEDGLGWGLCSPLCLMQCSNKLEKIHIQAAPQPSYTREIYVITRKNEYQPLVESILAQCAFQLKTVLLPEIMKKFSSINNEIVIDNNAIELIDKIK